MSIVSNDCFSYPLFFNHFEKRLILLLYLVNEFLFINFSFNFKPISKASNIDLPTNSLVLKLFCVFYVCAIFEDCVLLASPKSLASSSELSIYRLNPACNNSSNAFALFVKMLSVLVLSLIY